MIDPTVPLVVIAVVEAIAIAGLIGRNSEAIEKAVREARFLALTERADEIEKAEKRASDAASATEQLAAENVALREKIAATNAKPRATKAEWQAMIAARCEFCGYFHGNISCPRVRLIRYRPDKSVLSVEYWEQWDRSQVIVIEDVVVDEGLSPGAKAQESDAGAAQRP